MQSLTPLPAKTLVLGVGVSQADYGQVLRFTREWIDQKRAWEANHALAGKALARNPQPARYAAILTVHSVMTAFFDPAFRSILNQATLGTSDGMPLVWAARSFGVRGQRRVYGPDLMLALCGQAQRVGHRIFLYGGREETLPVLCSRLLARFPKLQIAGAYSPPFRPLTPAEDAICIEQICCSEADLIFCGIGVPKQERWMAEHQHELSGSVLFGVGAAFDFHAGRVEQAPRWMQRSGLEWAFRLFMEPGRLWRRYVFLNPMFLALWALQLAGLLRAPRYPSHQLSSGAK
ncbi:MAG: WecB/TagA/CpsF family glycosyltransferase [Acidobacteriota bacterium]|nr:WecB/TagA/CpsF family glycosyltransferase [Acidobacteriota bacterium]